jgi:hypothetical protein
METDSSARPHELLDLRIKDIEFKEGDGGKYAQIVVNGKTGERVLPLIDSIPYISQWISLHPQGSNTEALLFPNMKTGKPIQVNAIFKIYQNYKKYFTSLLSSENVPDEDKKKIRDLLKKRWNPYVHRHSAITEKSSILSSDSKLRVYAGWTPRSQMHHKYVHLGGGEASNDLLKAKGMIKDDKHSVNILSPKICPNPNCKESNRPDAQFCYRCNFIISFEGYQKSVEEHKRKEQEILELKDQMAQSKQEIKDRFQAYESKMAEFVHNIQTSLKSEETQHKVSSLVMAKMREILDRVAPDWYQEVFGPRANKLTPEAHKKVDEWHKILTAQIDAENSQRDLELQKQRKVLIDSMGRS